MTEIDQAATALACFFARHNIDPDSLTVILNITDRHAAAAFDWAFRASFNPYELHPRGDVTDIRQFTIRGLKFRVESPLHTP